MEFTYKTKQLIEINEKIGDKYDLEMCAYKNDIKSLVTLISVFGNVPFEEAEEELDKMIDNGKKPTDIYKDIFKGINEKAFFTQTLQVSTEVLPINMEKWTMEIYEKSKEAMEKEMAQEIIV